MVCFDVFLDEKFLVSECCDGMMLLWLFEIGKWLWEKVLLKLIKLYNEVFFGSVF